MMGITREVEKLLRPRGHWILACGAFYALLITAYFARALWRGDVIADDDATTEYYPQFGYPLVSWTRLLFCGYPLFADPQNMTFLPTRLLLSVLGLWNVFVLSGYVLAACWACVYAYEVTGDRLGALVAGLIYGATGHMLRNLTLVPMVQSMAWAPLVFWALERNVRRPSLPAVLIGGLALACSCFGGYGQITAYTAVLTLAYAGVGLFRARERGRFVWHAASLFVLGALLSAVQWLPTVELLLQSQRTHMPYGQFVGWTWTFIQSAQLFISRAFVGPWSEASSSASCELIRNGDTIYLGLLPMMLAAAGAWYERRSAITWFWCVAGVFSLTLAFGDRTPIASWLYHVPPYNLFRVMIRHSMFLALGASLLSACAIARSRGAARGARPLRVVGIASGAVLVTFALATWVVVRSGCSSLLGPGIGVSFIALLASAVVLAAWVRNPLNPRRGAMLVGCVALDLFTFDGWGEAVPRYGGRQLATPVDFTAPDAAEAVASELASSHQRMWGVKGQASGREELSVNRNLLWGVPSAGGYSPIAPIHVLDALDMAYYGGALGPFWDAGSAAVDVAAVRLVTLPDGSSAGKIGALGVRWADVDLGIRLGRALAPGTVSSEVLELPPVTVTAVGLVMDMERSANVSQASEIATVELGGEAPVRVSLLAGVDVSEWAIECPSERDRVRHGRATLYDARPVPLHGAVCPYQRYVSVRRLELPVTANRLKLTWSGSVGEAVVRVHKVTLLTSQNPDGVVVDRAVSALSGDARWLPRAPRPGHLMFENRRALPRARFVDAAVAMPLDGALTTLRTGRLPTGEPFDASRTALVLPGTRVETRPGCIEMKMDWLEDRDGLTSFSVDLPAQCFLVLADTFYSGWTARIDGRSTPIHRTNFAFRGVEVPAGQHRVNFEFASPTVRMGIGISAATACAAAWIALLPLLRRGRRR